MNDRASVNFTGKIHNAMESGYSDKNWIRNTTVKAHAFNHSTQKAEAGRYLWVQGQPGLQSEISGVRTVTQRNLVRLEYQKQNQKEKEKKTHNQLKHQFSA